MYLDRVEAPRIQLPLAPERTAKTQTVPGKKIKVVSNCFGLSLGSNGIIHHYSLSISPPCAKLTEEQYVMRQCWDDLSELFGGGAFIVRCPGHVFSPFEPTCDFFEKLVPACLEKGYGAHSVHLKYREGIDPKQVKRGATGVASIVFKHILKKLAEQLMYQRLGRRYFQANGTVDGKYLEGKHEAMLVSSFYCGLHTLRSTGPLMMLDTLNRVVPKRNIIETLQSCLDADPMQLQDPHVQQEWRRRCIGAVVMTLYKNRFYRVKGVDFNMTPQSEFLYSHKKDAPIKCFYLRFYTAMYQREISELRQPMLEAFAEKDNETVYLVPELCALISFSDDRKDKHGTSEALKQAKINPGERMQSIIDMATSIAEVVEAKNSPGVNRPIRQLLQDWRVKLQSKPGELDAVVHEPIELRSYSKKHLIEDGNFQKQLHRKDPSIPQAHLRDWLFIYPESDAAVLDIWLQSLCDIAIQNWNFYMADPTRLACSDQRVYLMELLENNITDSTQLVLLLTPQKEAKKVYQIFKQVTATRFPCITQVVKSETIRKRQSIAAVLSRIVLQMSAKFLGPLWSVELAAAATAPLMEAPTMVIGIDVYTTIENGMIQRFIGFAASLDSQCAEYFSMAAPLEGPSDMSIKIQKFLKEALEQFCSRNNTLLPEHFIVYRASATEDKYSAIVDTEVAAMNALLGEMQGRIFTGYRPTLTFVAIAKRVYLRFFQPQTVGYTNPDPGTIVEAQSLTGRQMNGFYLVSQAVGKGSTLPSQYVVLYDSANLQATALQSFTYRLCFLYFSNLASIKMPAPAQYAKKIAHLVGTAIHKEPHQRLRCTFFYV